jgi:hypothetical protein
MKPYLDEYNFDIVTLPVKGYREYDNLSFNLVDIPDRMSIHKKSDGTYLGNHSTAYRPVEHKSIVDPIYEMMEKVSADFVPDIRVMQNGSMLKATFTCKDITIQDPALQDYIAFRITVRNSYNGAWSVMITADGLRYWCNNGCTTADKIANYTQKHNGKFYYKFEHIEHLIQEFKSNEQRYRAWYNTPVTHHDANEMFNKLTYTPRPTVDGRYRNERQFQTLMDIWARYQKDIGCNKWGLYNAVTDWISHPQEVKNKHKTTVERNSKLLSYMNRPNSMFYMKGSYGTI